MKFLCFIADTSGVIFEWGNASKPTRKGDPMKKTSRFFLLLGLLTVLLASACASSVSSPPVVDAPTSAEPVSVETAIGTATQPPVQTEAAALSASTEAAPPVATSRGPDLHATDPATVALASGQLQLVEFFRFT